jgi:glycosyltransferase involved in cell wall biosynthesis
MRRIYQSARIVLVPSILNEAWARVVTEAQISGIPILASDRGGLPESVGPGGILVDPDADISDWEKALSRLWDVKQLEATLSARRSNRNS